MMEPDFRFFKLGLGSRLVAAGLLYAAVAAIQVFGPGGPLFIAPLAAAWIVMALKPVSNKPKDKGLEEWRPVSMAEVDRIVDNIKAARALRAKLAGPAALGVLALVGLSILSVVSLAFSDILALAAFDLALFSIPGLFFGRLKVFTPPELELKLPCFNAIATASLPKGYVLTPYLRFDKDEDGRDLPEDLRFMLEAVRKPADFVGVQFQAAVNNGPNGKVPYLYAVVLTKGRTGASYAAARAFKDKAYVVEAGGDGDYGTVVIRQKTSGTGYHTKPKDCERLLAAALKALGSAA